MKFPNAAKGVSKIFTAEILSLIALIATGIMSIWAAITVAAAPPEGSEEVSTVFAAGAIGMIAFGAIAGIIAVIALIINIVGVVQASKDESAFKAIIYLVIFSIIVSVVATIFTGNQFAANLSNAIAEIVHLVCTVLVVLGIATMATQLQNEKVIAKGGTILKLIIWVGILAIIARLFAIFLPSTSAAVIITILAIVALVLSIAQYCIYLSFLSNAKKMLNQE